MANTPDYHWPAPETRKVIGTSPKRLDGPVKATGRAKYSSDLNLRGMLFGAYQISPHAHARVLAVDTSEAEKVKGVVSIWVASRPGTEVQWQGFEIAAVAATTAEIAREAARRINVSYEVLPHFVKDDDLPLAMAGGRGKAAGEKLNGKPDDAFQNAEVISEATYGIPVVTHACFESHGVVIQWVKGDKEDGSADVVNAWASVQFLSGYAASLAPNLKIPATNIKARMDYVGGGFGSKFTPDAWAEVGANLSRLAGGRPVKLFLDRTTDQLIAGNRPSTFANIRVGGSKDGTITAWQSQSWGTGGFGSVGGPPLPYIIDKIPNTRVNHTAISTNTGPQRAWRAPNQQQAAYMTWSAVEDWAAKAGLDPIEVFLKNAGYAPEARVETYRYQLQKAAELAEWKKLWHPRGENGKGPVKRGLGVAMNAWAGGGHQSQCRCVINPDGSVAIEIGTQDLGTGTRTIITQVAAETLGLPMSKIKLTIGSNELPFSGSSGGSTTVGGVSASTRKATMNALWKLFETVAPVLDAPVEQLEAVDGAIRVKENPSKSVTWESACRRMTTGKISEMGENNQRTGASEGLQTANVGGVQIADVSVDTETGIVRINRFVAVQDCGMVINPWLAQSVCYGAIIMGLSTALFEERIMDRATGRMLNPNLEFYKLAGIKDIGNILVHLDIRPENDKRGVIGLGEPPAIGICGAVGNAVANAIGVRVPHMPMTPMHVLNVLEGRSV